MYRKYPLRTGNIYHVFNRGIASQLLFSNRRDYQRFCELMNYYRFVSPDMRFSFYNRLELESKNKFMKTLLEKGQKQILIYVFCLLPNHFHFLLKEIVEEGIKKFISNLQNSYARYFNIKNNRKGALFQEMFKAVRIETDEQFLHVSRYIHLNPYSNFFIKEVSELLNYPWSSLLDYLEQEGNFSFLDKDFLNSYYPTFDKLKTFTLDQADYQKKLKEIEYFLIE